MSIDRDNLQDVYILEFYAALDVPRSLTCHLLHKYGEHRQLVELSFEPLHYNDLETARSSLAATKFLSKATFLSTNIDIEAVASEKFLAAEKVCQETNERIQRNRFKNPYSAGVLMHMRFQTEAILSSFDADEFVDSCNWGPGATTLLPRRVTTHPKKFSAERKITAEAYDFVKPWFHLAYPHWDMTFEIDGESKIVTVPKDAKSSRTIAIEPGINLWFQKGIGAMMRRRLKRIGIDLNDQRANQEKARVGSLFARTATVDFSSASDSVAFKLVEESCPHRWFTLMKTFRSSCGRAKGGPLIEFNKFSSMGNGFTFELESLLFYTMAVACCHIVGCDTKEVSVYGDDVILPIEAFDLFESVSADLGFSFNRSKSFDNSYYRESCGEHYWNGFRIKPIFQKEPLDGQTSLILAANNVRRLARSRRNSGCDYAFRRCYRLFTEVLGHDCPRISEGYGDVGLIENIDESVVKRAGHGYEGYLVRVWSVVSTQLELRSPGLLLTRLKSIGNSRTMESDTKCRLPAALWYLDAMALETLAGGNFITLPGCVRLSRKRLLIPRWLDLGPWC